MSNDNTSEFSGGFNGKKIFFLYPSTIIQNEVVFELIQQEYEVYSIKDHLNFKRALLQFPDSIVFINIDERMPQADWDNWIKETTADPALSNVGIGILSGTRDPDIQKKYASSSKIQCGFTAVYKTDILRTVKQIHDILQAVEARGRRKYVRVNTELDTNTTINIPFNGQFINGNIRDISVVGFSCSFLEDPELEKNSLCKDMQIKLQSMLLKGEGIVFGSRMESGNKVYVFLLTQRVDPEVRVKIRTFIQSSLQSKMDLLLK